VKPSGSTPPVLWGESKKEEDKKKKIIGGRRTLRKRDMKDFDRERSPKPVPEASACFRFTRSRNNERGPGGQNLVPHQGLGRVHMHEREKKSEIRGRGGEAKELQPIQGACRLLGCVAGVGRKPETTKDHEVGEKIHREKKTQKDGELEKRK